MLGALKGEAATEVAKMLLCNKQQPVLVWVFGSILIANKLKRNETIYTKYHKTSMLNNIRYHNVLILEAESIYNGSSCNNGY